MFSGAKHPGWAKWAPGYVLDTNLTGALNYLKHLRRWGGDMILLSSSRVYSITALTDLPLELRGERLEIAEGVARTV